MWVQVALFIASLVISHLMMPKPQQAKPSAFDDFKFPTIDDGTPKIVVFGDVWITDWCVIGVGNYRTSAITKKQKGLFGGKRQTVGHRYLMSLHMGLCLAMDELVAIKIGDRLAWGDTVKNLATVFSFQTLKSGEFSEFDVMPADEVYRSSANINRLRINQPHLFGGDEKEGGVKGILTVMKGASDQAPLPELQQMHNSPVPAYRGVVTLFFDGIVGNSPYPKTWAFRVRRTACEWYNEKATIWLTGDKGEQIKAMNPAHIIFEAQTNEDWGRGTDIGQLDLDSFKQCADTLFDERFGMCIAWKRQDTLKQFIQQILDHIGGALMIDRTTGLWKLVLIRESDKPDSLPSFDYGIGMLRIEEDNNSSNDLVTNQLVVSYTDPVSNETRTVRTENLASIQRDGTILQNKNYIGLPTAELAGRVASRDMKIIQSHLKKFKVVLDRRAYALQPASAFVLKIPQRGIDSIIMRAVRVEHGTLTNGEITVTAVQDVFGLPRTTYSQVQPSLWIQPSLSPEPIIHSRLWQLPYPHLLEVFSPEQLTLNSDGYALVLAERPNSLQQGFEIWAKTTGEQDEQYAGQGQFVSRGVVQNAVAQTSQTTTLTLDNIGVISIGQCALLNDEIVQIAHIDLAKKQIQVKRGCMDTVPTAHAQTSVIWFYDDVAVVADKAVKAGQTLNVKLLSQTSQGTLDIAKATANSLLIDNRHTRPFAPADVKINELPYPSQIQTLNKISWVGRNKISQNTAILDQTAPHQTPETGATVSLIISKKTSANDSYQRVVQKDGITGFFIDIVKENPNNDESKLVASLDNAVMIKVELWAVKDGLESWQRHSIEVAVG